MAHLPAEEGQFITCTAQTNYNSLVHSSPRLHRATLKDSSTWGRLANCRTYLPRLKNMYFIIRPGSPLGFFSLPFSSWVAFTPFPLKDRCSSLFAFWPPFFFPFASCLWGQWPCDICHTSAARGHDLPHAAHWWAPLSWEKEKEIYLAVLCLQTPGFNPHFPAPSAAARMTTFAELHISCLGRCCFSWLVAVGLVTICLCGSPAQCCNYQSY